MRPTPSHLFLGAALAASLAGNAYALWPRDDDGSHHRPPAPRAAPTPKARPVADPAAELRACEDRLKARQAKDALRSLAAGLRASRATTGGDGDEASGSAAELRCRIAEKQLRDRWREKEKETIADLRASLAKAAEQERNAASEARRFADSLGARPADRDRLVERYRPLRLARMAEIAAAIGAEPVDWDAATAAVRGLWADEDRLIADLFGTDAAGRFAADAEEGRLAVLMIAAALGGGPWPDAVF
jgi:hypothetical protein